MQKHRKHIRRWPKLASLVAAGASLLGFMIVVPARAVPADPTPSCNGAICTWSFEVSDEPYQWRAPDDAAQVWLDVQGASGPGGEPLHWKGELLNPQWQLQIEHLPNGLVAIRSFPPGPGEFVYAAPSGWNQSWVNDQAFARVDLIPAMEDADGIATITTISSPRVTSFTVATGSGDISASGAIEFSEPVTGLDASDFVIWSSGHGCRFESIQAFTRSSFTFEMRGCLIARAAVNLAPMSVQGLLPGPQGWVFGPDVVLNVAAAVSPTIPAPGPSASAATSAAPSSSPTPAPEVTQQAPAVAPVVEVNATPVAEPTAEAEAVAVVIADSIAVDAVVAENEVGSVVAEVDLAGSEVEQALAGTKTVVTEIAFTEPISQPAGDVQPSEPVAESRAEPRAERVAEQPAEPALAAVPEPTVATAAAAIATGIAAALATACWLVVKQLRKVRANPSRRPQIRLRALGASGPS